MASRLAGDFSSWIHRASSCAEALTPPSGIPAALRWLLSCGSVRSRAKRIRSRCLGARGNATHAMEQISGSCRRERVPRSASFDGRQKPNRLFIKGTSDRQPHHPFEHVGVDHGGGNILVAEEFLHAANLKAGFQKAGSEAVPKSGGLTGLTVPACLAPTLTAYCRARSCMWCRRRFFLTWLESTLIFAA